MGGFKAIQLVGKGIRLRPVTPEDAPSAYTLVKDQRVTRTLSWDGPASLEALEESFRQRAGWFEQGAGKYTMAIEIADRPGMIGSIEARSGPEHAQQVNIGYWLGAPHWGRGLATEAVRLICGFAFEQLGAVRVFALVFAGNVASARVLEKNGFTLEGALRCAALKGGAWLDEWAFSLLRREWHERRDWYLPVASTIVTAP